MRENGGSRTRLCSEKMHRSRTSLASWNVPASSVKKRCRRVGRDLLECTGRVAAGPRDGQRRLVDVGAEHLHLGCRAQSCPCARAAGSRSNRPPRRWRSRAPRPARCRSRFLPPTAWGSRPCPAPRRPPRRERMWSRRSAGRGTARLTSSRILPQAVDIGGKLDQLHDLHPALHPAQEGLLLVAGEIVADLVAQDGADLAAGRFRALLRGVDPARPPTSVAGGDEAVDIGRPASRPSSSTGTTRSTSRCAMALARHAGVARRAVVASPAPGSARRVP